MVARTIAFFAIVSLAACGDLAPPTPTPQANTTATTPVALDPNRPQPPPPTAHDVSRKQERAPR